jgi:ribosomal protein L13
MSKGKMKAQHIISTISAESVLITGESNWIQMLLREKRAKGGRGEEVLSSELANSE